jgi:hypothetical protein
MKLKPGTFYNVRINSIFTIHRLVPLLPDSKNSYYVITLGIGNYVLVKGQSILDTFGDSIYIGRYE